MIKMEDIETPEVSPDPSPIKNPKIKRYVIVKEYQPAKNTPKKVKQILQKVIPKEQILKKDEKNSLQSVVESLNSHGSLDDVQKSIDKLKLDLDLSKTFLVDDTDDVVDEITTQTSCDTNELYSTQVANERDPQRAGEWSTGNKWFTKDITKMALIGALVLGGSAGIYHYNKQ